MPLKQENDQQEAAAATADNSQRLHYNRLHKPENSLYKQMILCSLLMYSFYTNIILFMEENN